MTIQWKAVVQYFTVVLLVFQFCNFGKCINFGLGTVGIERVKKCLCMYHGMETVHLPRGAYKKLNSPHGEKT